jgi:putative membrane protein insertion efficiency factor
MYRAAFRALRAAPKTVVLGLVKAYQYSLRIFSIGQCRFYPCCSDYSLQAIERFGVIWGLVYTLKRLLKCHPLHPGGEDPVPQTPSFWGSSYHNAQKSSTTVSNDSREVDGRCDLNQ